jgi:hypothetical protein
MNKLVTRREVLKMISFSSIAAILMLSGKDVKEKQIIKIPVLTYGINIKATPNPNFRIIPKKEDNA